jgi:hypothetical protein
MSQESPGVSGLSRAKGGGGCTLRTQCQITDSYRRGEREVRSPDEPTMVSVHGYDTSFAENATANDEKNDL